MWVKNGEKKLKKVDVQNSQIGIPLRNLTKMLHKNSRGIG
jgi:hypothetical protein